MTDSRPQSEHESERLAALDRTPWFQDAYEPMFGQVTELARELLGTTHACVTLVGEHYQWFKSSTRNADYSVPREHSFCSHTVAGGEAFVVSDTHDDPLFARNPFVTGTPFIRFYAGIPLTFEGQNVGALCVLDSAPRPDIGEREINLLRQLATFLERCLPAASVRRDDQRRSRRMLASFRRVLRFTSLPHVTKSLSESRLLAVTVRRTVTRSVKAT